MVIIFKLFLMGPETVITMILLATRNRPDNIERFAQYYRTTQAKATVMLVCDHDDQSLDDITLPDNFHIAKINIKQSGIIALTSHCIEMFPHEKWYGFLTDRTVPKTMHWDQQIITALNTNKQMLIHCKDNLDNEGNCNFYFIRGDLLRAHGSYCPCELVHYYLDNYWYALCSYFKIRVYLSDVTLDYNMADMDDQYYERRIKIATQDKRTIIDYMESKKWQTDWAKVQRFLGLQDNPLPNIKLYTNDK